MGENERKIKENKIETKSIVFNSDIVLDLTQENLIEFQVQTNLPYISQTVVCIYTILSYMYLP